MQQVTSTSNDLQGPHALRRDGAAADSLENPTEANEPWSVYAEADWITPESVDAPVPDDVALVRRLVVAYQRASQNLPPSADGMWQGIFTNLQQDLDSIFRSDDVAAAAKVLRDPGSTNLFYGFDNLALAVRDYLTDPVKRAKHAAICLQNLVRIAEVTGAIRPFSAEQHVGNCQPPVCWEADAVLDHLDRVLGYRLCYPNLYPHEAGLKTSRGILSVRVPHALYQAWRLKKLVAHIRKPKVLEIGAGLGRTAHFARQLGISDYTIVDLPLTAISQGYFLGRTLGADNMVLSGESSKRFQPNLLTRFWPSRSAKDAKIKIFSPRDFFKSKTRYDVVLNADSLTEMPLNAARRYLHAISKRAKAFVSINHEYNSFSVRQLLHESCGNARVLRHMYPLRQGYVEELVQF